MIKNFLARIIQPVVEEFPFFVVMMLLIGYRAIYMLIFHFQMWMHEPEYPRLRIIGITLVYSYLLTLIVFYSKRIWVKVILYSVFTFLFCLNIYLLIAFNSGILLSTMLLLFETNTTEAHDFVLTYIFSRAGFMTLIFILIITLVTIVAERRRCIFPSFYRRLHELVRMTVSVIFCCFLLCGLYSFHLYYDLFKCDNTDETDVWSYKVNMIFIDQITNCVFTTYNLHLTGKNLALAESITRSVCAQPISIKDGYDSTNVILVIGESFIKYHSSLYGYPLKTNPRLEQESQKGNLYVFNDVISPFIYTSDAVRNMLSTNSVGDGEKWYDHPYLPAIFHQAGYHVMFWDNQYSTSTGPFDFTLNAYLHSPEIGRLSYDQKRGFISNIDGEMLDDFLKNNEIFDKRSNRFIVFHLQGQHFSPESHYPQLPEFNVFTAKDVKNDANWITNKNSEEIALYDNCTQYNDSVLLRIIDIFRSESTILVYLSDHGENVYDLGNYTGRRISDVTSSDIKKVRYLLDVPFVIWCSDRYKKFHPDIERSINSATEKPMMTDNVSHLLMRVGGGLSNEYRESRDVLSSAYQCPPRIVVGSLNYDGKE